jgi:hypothetical protein
MLGSVGTHRIVLGHALSAARDNSVPQDDEDGRKRQSAQMLEGQIGVFFQHIAKHISHAIFRLIARPMRNTVPTTWAAASRGPYHYQRKGTIGDTFNVPHSNAHYLSASHDFALRLSGLVHKLEIFD